MHRPAIAFVTLLFLVGSITAQPPPSDKSEQMLEALSKKIDEQNAKIDTLSQQILKLEQEISKNTRPGVMIGETPSPAPATSRAPAASGRDNQERKTGGRGRGRAREGGRW